MSYINKYDSRQENDTVSQEKGSHTINLSVGLAQMKNMKSNQDSIALESKSDLGFFRRIATTGLIPYLAVPSHNYNIPAISLVEDIHTRSYWTRWYVLFVCAVIFYFMAIIWGTFGPIAESVKMSYNWSDQAFAGLSLIHCVVTMLICFPMMWFTQVCGIRSSLLFAAVVAAISSTLRCLTMEEGTFLVLSRVCSVGNAVSSSIQLSIPATIAATWFPINERDEAIAILSATRFGTSFAFVASSLVTVPESKEANDIFKSKKEINLLMTMYAGVMWMMTVLAFIYLPARPPDPPSITSARKTLSFRKGVKAILSNRDALLVCIAYIVSFSVPGDWMSVLNFSLVDMGFSQEEIWPIGFTAALVSGVAAIVSGAIADKLCINKRVQTICLLILSTLSFLIILLMQVQVIYASFWLVLICVTCGISFQFASVPLLTDMAVGIAYPCSAEVVGAVCCAGINATGIIFLGAFQIPVTSYLWVTIVLLLSQCLMIIPLLFISEPNNRIVINRVRVGCNKSITLGSLLSNPAQR